MRVVCEANVGTALPPRYFERGFTQSSAFDLTIGTEYIVYGISFWLGFPLYLIVGEDRRPHWYPAELFQVSRTELPGCWYFAFFGSKDDLNAVCGYDELVNKWDHYDQLSNLDQHALEVFEVRRQEIDSIS